VENQTSTGQRVNQYWFAVVTSTALRCDHYWSERESLLLRARTTIGRNTLLYWCAQGTYNGGESPL